MILRGLNLPTNIIQAARYLSFAALLSCVGCAHSRLANAPDRPVYVSVFVDETSRGELGYEISEVAKEILWQDVPAKLALQIDPGTIVVDGTVLAHDERAAGDEDVEVRMEIAVRVLEDGKLPRMLPRSQVFGRFTGKPFEATSRRRNELRRMMRTLAIHMLDSLSS